jgi:hypothetical protein
MVTGSAAPGGRQREITELFRFKKPKLNEQSTHATGEVGLFLPQSNKVPNRLSVCLKRMEEAARSAIVARGHGQGRP